MTRRHIVLPTMPRTGDDVASDFPLSNGTARVAADSVDGCPARGGSKDSHDSTANDELAPRSLWDFRWISDTNTNRHGSFNSARRARTIYFILNATVDFSTDIQILGVVSHPFEAGSFRISSLSPDLLHQSLSASDRPSRLSGTDSGGSRFPDTKKFIFAGQRFRSVRSLQ